MSIGRVHVTTRRPSWVHAVLAALAAYAIRSAQLRARSPGLDGACPVGELLGHENNHANTLSSCRQRYERVLRVSVPLRIR